MIDLQALRAVTVSMRLSFISSDLERLRGEVRAVYRDIAGAELKAAHMALAAAASSSDAATDIRDAISHLRSAYFMIDSVLAKKTSTYVPFTKMLWSQKPVVENDERFGIAYLGLASTVVIAILYQELRQIEPIADFRRMGYQLYRTEIEPLFRTFGTSETLSDDQELVLKRVFAFSDDCFHREHTIHLGPSGDPVGGEKCTLTALGLRRLEETKASLYGSMLWAFELSG